MEVPWVIRGGKSYYDDGTVKQLTGLAGAPEREGMTGVKKKLVTNIDYINKMRGAQSNANPTAAGSPSLGISPPV